MYKNLDELRIEALHKHKLATIYQAEAVDETSFMGNRLTVEDLDMTGFTKLSSITKDTTHATKCLQTMLRIHEALDGAWTESEIVFRDQPASPSVKIKNSKENVPLSEKDIIDPDSVIKAMLENGWGFSDQISEDRAGHYKKFYFTRDNWHDVELITPVQIGFRVNLANYSIESFLEMVLHHAKLAVDTWNSMPETIPKQNGFGAIVVDSISTQYAFGGARQSPTFTL